MSKHPVALILTLRCEEASRLASESLDRPLGPTDRWALRLHTWICGPCRCFLRQIRQIRRIATSAAELSLPGPPLPEDVRERIKRSLRG